VAGDDGVAHGVSEAGAKVHVNIEHEKERVRWQRGNASLQRLSPNTASALTQRPARPSRAKHAQRTGAFLNAPGSRTRWTGTDGGSCAARTTALRS
jgi:hypothetical protein